VTTAKNLMRPVWALGVSLLVMTAGCGQSEEPVTTGALPSDYDAPAGGSADQSAALAQSYTNQIDQYVSQVESLASKAKSVGDEKLDGLIDSINDELAKAQKKVDELKSAKESAVAKIEEDLDAITGEIGELYQQAMARLAEVQAGANLPEGIKLPGGG
jgi:peptidoglycan hydrolase CwlO-like protein